MKTKIGKVLVIILLVILAAVLIWGGYWFAKNKWFKKTSGTLTPEQIIEKTVVGTVESISADKITVTSISDKKEIKINSSTKFRKTPPEGGLFSDAKISDVQKGDNVAILVTGKASDANLTATQIDILPKPQG
ncbi:MAG: hypothetical protein M1338_02320 [Patescibacteria group bacterium]|nr:hypothetical protein [Patescibacteria group bacterium]